MNTQKVITVSAVVLLFGACSSTQVATPEAPVEVRVSRLLPKAKNLRGAAIAVRLEVSNGRSEAVHMSQISYTIDTGDVSGKITGTADAEAVLEANQTAELEFEQSIPFPEEPGAYRAILEKGEIEVDVSGQLIFEDDPAIDFSRKGSVITPRLPKFIVHEAQAARYGKQGVDVTLMLRLMNENIFPVSIDGVTYKITINEQEMKSEQGAIGVKLIGGAAQEFEVSVTLDERYSGIKQLLADKKLTYGVTGKIELTNLEIPFEHGDEIQLGGD